MNEFETLMLFISIILIFLGGIFTANLLILQVLNNLYTMFKDARDGQNRYR